MTAHGDHDVLRSMLRELEREAPNMSEALIPADRNRAFPGAIFVAAQWALQPIRLALLTARRETVDTILDLPCGSGRVLRALRAEFPHAHITACDINPHVVDYCAETFGATPVYSRENPEDIEIEGPFDLIWCGSLLTHLDQPLWTSFLRMFESLLEPGGVLVFTTCGRFAAERLRRHNLGFTDAQAEELLQRYDQDGFGYCDYAMSAEERAEQFLPHYGLAVATPQWTCARLQEDAWRLDLLSYTAGGHGDRWGDHRPSNGYNGQDFVSCIRIKGER